MFFDSKQDQFDDSPQKKRKGARQDPCTCPPDKVVKMMGCACGVHRCGQCSGCLHCSTCHCGRLNSLQMETSGDSKQLKFLSHNHAGAGNKPRVAAHGRRAVAIVPGDGSTPAPQKRPLNPKTIEEHFSSSASRPNPTGQSVISGTSPAGTSKKAAEVFLSYQWDHQETVIVVRQWLEKAGFRCWMDIKRMSGGDMLYSAIEEGVREAKVVVAFLTQAYCRSRNCQKELTFADLKQKPIVPVLLEKLDWPPEGLAMQVSGMLYIPLYQGIDKEKLAQLKQQITKILDETSCLL